MGLDAYIYRISKPDLPERAFTREELSAMPLSRASVEAFENNINLYRQLKPYVVKRDVTYSDINLEKIISDYNLPPDSYIYFYSLDKIVISGVDKNCNEVSQTISGDNIMRDYLITITEPYYIWKEEEEAYWRKNWDLVEWLERTMKKPLENTGYYRLNATLIHRINSKFGSHATEESATKESAMFYWHWY